MQILFDVTDPIVAILPFADDGLAEKSTRPHRFWGDVAILPFADDGLAALCRVAAAATCVVAILPFADDGLAALPQHPSLFRDWSQSSLSQMMV